MLTWGEYIDTLAEVGKVGPLVTQGRSANSDGLLRGSGRVRASIPVVVTSSDGKVHARSDSLVNSIVQSQGLSTTQRHVGDRSRLSGSSVLGLGGASLLAACSAAHRTPPTTSAMVPLPLEPRTLTAMRLTALETPYFREPTVLAQWVP